MPNRFYLTTPIYYVNDVPHIGTAYTTLAADVVARFHRLLGDEVLFATGTDENAPKVAVAAEKAGQPPQAFVDVMAERFQDAWRRLNIEPDVFIRTSEPRHHRAVRSIFQRLQEAGEIYQGDYEGWYCMSCETYFNADEAPEVDGARPCPDVPGHPPLQRVKETNYFFALSRYGDRLKAHIEAHPEFLQPDFRRNEVLAFIDQGLRDVCITRAATNWGIPVPGDPSQVIYVWFDALINYITLTGYPDEQDQLAHWWPAALHLVGKDIYVRFHCTLWPAMLMAAGLPLPRSILGHGFWMSEGRKMSKTLGNFIEPLKLADWLAELSGAEKPVAVDALRYFLFREMPFGEDGNFSRHSLLQRFNSDLANDLGNALNRSLSMSRQWFGEAIPEANPEETRLVELSRQIHPRISDALHRLDLQGALALAWEFISAINKYLDDRKPWALAREMEDPKVRRELAGVLRHALEAVRVATVWLTPYLPVATAEIRRQLALPVPTRWDEAADAVALPEGGCTAEPRPVFPRIEKKVLAEALKAVQDPSPNSLKEKNVTTEVQPAPAPATPPAVEPEEASPLITIDDFLKVRLQVAEVLTCERVPKSDKLLHFRVSLGSEERTVLAGLAEHYDPADLPGKRVVMVTNLEPRKMRGIESQGMLLAAEADGVVKLLTPDGDLPAGSSIR